MKCAVLTKPTRNTAEAQKHVQLIASVQQARRCTLGIQASKQEVFNELARSGLCQLFGRGFKKVGFCYELDTFRM